MLKNKTQLAEYDPIKVIILRATREMYMMEEMVSQWCPCLALTVLSVSCSHNILGPPSLGLAHYKGHQRKKGLSEITGIEGS